jgi:hypothetical protein
MKKLFSLAFSLIFLSGVLFAQDVSFEISHSCPDSNTGSITATVLSEDFPGPYSFIWTNVDGVFLSSSNDDTNTISTIDNLSSGFYCLLVVSIPTGCVASSCNLEIQDDGIDIIGLNSTCICPGGFATIDITATGLSGPFAYEWQGPQGSGYVSYEEDPDDITFPGVYTVTVTNSEGCQVEMTTNVEMCSSNTTVTPTMVNCICPGGFGSIEIDVEGNDAPYSFIWLEPGGNNVFSEQNPSLLTETGDYTLTVTGNSGCTSTLMVNVPPCDFSFSNFIVNINNSCDGPGTGSIEVIIPPGIGSAPYLFEWSDSEGNPVSQVNTNSNITTASGLSAGEYCLEVFSAGLCYASSCGLIISEAEPPTVSYTIEPETFEGNDGQIHLIVNGNSGPFTYLWSNGATTPDTTGLVEGQYTVTISYGNSACSLVEEIEVLGCESLAAEIELLADVYALSGGNPNGDGAIDLTVSGGENYSFNYSWSSPSGFTSSLEDISGLKAGTYYVTVTHSLCSNIGKTGFWELCDFGVRISRDQSNPNTCSGMQLIAVPNTYQPSQFPFSYLWSDGSTTESVTAAYNSEYCVTVTSATGCSAKACFNTNIAPLEITAQMLENATFGNPDGSATAHAQGWFGSYTYNWSNGMTGETIFGVPAGLYTVTVTAACGVTATTQVEIACEFSTADFNPQVTPVNCQLNKYGIIKLNPSQAVLELNPVFQWSNGETTQDIFGLLPGEYSVTVTGVTNNTTECHTSMTITVPKFGSGGISTPLSVNAGCPGANQGEIILNASGGFPPYSYQWATWYGSQPLAPDPTISNLMPGWYFVTVTDEAGCTNTNWTMVAPQPNINAQVSVLPAVICPGETATATVQASGGVLPYNYVWQDCYPCTPFAGNNSSVSGLSSGPYMVTVTDQNSCKRELYFSVQGSNMKMNAQVHHPCEKKGTDGFVQLNVGGGIPPYSYLWSNGSTGAGVDNLSEGPISVTVTDANGCVKAESYYIKHESINLNIYAGTLPCPDGTNGSLSVNSNLGGHPPFQYNWSNGSTQSSLSGLPSGFYCVTVTDANGCSASKCQYLKNRFDIIIEKIKNPTAYNSNDGLIHLSVTGSGGPFLFNWSNGATTEDITGLSPNIYHVTITSNTNSCTVTRSFDLLYDCVSTLNFPLEIYVNEKNNLTSANANDGSISLEVSYGAENFIYYQWTGPSGYTANTKDIAGLVEGKYCVTVTDGCDTKTLCEWIGYCGDNTVSFVPYQNGYNGTCIFPGGDADLNTTIKGFTGEPSGDWFVWNNPANLYNSSSNYYNWSIGKFKFTVNHNALGTTHYQVTVTDDAGCSAVSGFVTLYPASTVYSWKSKSILSEFGSEVYDKFLEDINNDPSVNFVLDKYVSGWERKYVCNFNEVANGGSGSGVISFVDVSADPPIQLTNDCNMPQSFDVSTGQNPLTALYADNVQKVSSYTKDLGNCKRRDYCLYWSYTHYQNGFDPVFPIPFVFVSPVYTDNACVGGGSGGGGGGEDCTEQSNVDYCVSNESFSNGTHTCTIYQYCSLNECDLNEYFPVGFSQGTNSDPYWTVNEIVGIINHNPGLEPYLGFLTGAGSPCPNGWCSCEIVTNALHVCPECLTSPSQDGTSKLLTPNPKQEKFLRLPKERDRNANGLIMNVYPNPFKDELNIAILSPESRQVEIAITNILGTTVWSGKNQLVNGIVNIKWSPVQSIPSGLYQVRAIDENGIQTVKNVVMTSQ